MTYQVETITGVDVAAARKRHKLTRPQFMELAGIGGKSTARLINIERLESWKSGDREAVVEALNRLDGVPPTAAPPDEVLYLADLEDDPPEEDSEEDDLLTVCAEESPAWHPGTRWIHVTEDGSSVTAALVSVDTSVLQELVDVPWLKSELDAQRGATVHADLTGVPTVEVDGVEVDASPELLGPLQPVPTSWNADLQEEYLPVPDEAHESDYATSGFPVSNSLLQDFKRCRRKWWLRWYRSLALQTESYVGIRSTGTRIHAALAAWYVPDGQVRVDPREALERVVVEDWTKIATLAESRGADQDQMTSLAEEFAKSTNLERAMVEGYVQWLEETGVDSGLRIIASETTLTAELETASGNPVLAIGLLDARGYREMDGARMFLDHKSVQELTSPPLTLQQDEQMLHYHLLEFLNTADGEARCDGALYNMLRRVKRTARASPPFYDRVPIYHNSHELESYRTRMLAAADEVVAATERLERGESHLTAAYPSPRPSCRYDCDFFAVCGLFDDGSRAEAMVDALYHPVDPNERYLTRDGVSL